MQQSDGFVSWYSPGGVSDVGVVGPGGVCAFSSGVIVDVDGDREKALKGPRWVSLSSIVVCQRERPGPKGPSHAMQQIAGSNGTYSL